MAEPCRYFFLTEPTDRGVRHIWCTSRTCTNSGLSSKDLAHKDHHSYHSSTSQNSSQAIDYCTNGGVKPGGLFSKPKLCPHYHDR